MNIPTYLLAQKVHGPRFTTPSNLVTQINFKISTDKFQLFCHTNRLGLGPCVFYYINGLDLAKTNLSGVGSGGGVQWVVCVELC